MSSGDEHWTPIKVACVEVRLRDGEARIEFGLEQGSEQEPFGECRKLVIFTSENFARNFRLSSTYYLGLQEE